MSNITKIAAIFDFDRTIIRVDSFHLFLRIIYFKKLFYWLPWLAFIGIIRKFRLINLEQFKLFSLRPLKDFTKGDIDFIGKKFFKNYLMGEFYKDALEKIKWHKKKGNILILATSCPNLYIDYVSVALGFDKVICTELNYKDNRFDGTFKGNDKFHKVKSNYVYDLCKLNNFEINKSYFYTDNESDLPTCKFIKNVYFINPSNKLKKKVSYKNYQVLYWK